MLVIRGELLKKYPTAVVYAHHADWTRDRSNVIDVHEPRSLAHSIGYAPDSFIIEPRNPGQFALGHFLGTTWGRLLQFVLRKQKLLGGKCTPFFADISGPLPEMDKFFGSPLQIQDTLDKAIAANNAIFARMLDAGPFRSCLPDDILNAWIHDALDVPAFIETLMKAQFYQGSVIPEQ